ncbi:MAG: hypothetical protein IJY63_05585 [Clostridia bacterium]|nr:hypothetical protein [Clostridia bacterium]
MRLKIKKGICIALFLLLSVLSVGSFSAFMWHNPSKEANGRVAYQSSGLIQLKRGEKISFADALEISGTKEKYEELSQRYENTLKVHDQSAYHLTIDRLNEKAEDVTKMVYIDEDGYIRGVQTGVYQLEYTFGVAYDPIAKKESYNAYTFNFLICVYEGDEDKFQPLPDTPAAMREDNAYGKNNYILTKDITWYAEDLWTVGLFYGTLINPHGYTLTWNIDRENSYLHSNDTKALFGINKGYIDGLKVRVVCEQDNPVTNVDFYGLVEQNHGVLQNCTIEGTVYICNETKEPYQYFYALPMHGFSYNNRANMAVWAYGDCLIYEGNKNGVSDSKFSHRVWQEKNNVAVLQWGYYD